MGGFIIQQRIQRGAIIQIQSTGSQQKYTKGKIKIKNKKSIKHTKQKNSDKNRGLKKKKTKKRHITTVGLPGKIRKL